MNSSPTLRVICGRIPHELALNDIVFIEVFNWKCLIHRVDRSCLETNTPLKELQSLLPAGQFVRCSRSFLVNLAHVAAIGDDALLTDTGDRIDLPTRMRQAIRRQSAEYFLQQSAPPSSE